MPNNANSIIPIAARVGRSLAARLFFLRKDKTAPTTSAADDLWLSATMSAMTEEQSAEGPDGGPDEDVNPLVEAEIYAIFGRISDAEQVLASALRAGRIGGDEVAWFWQGLESELKITPGRCTKP